MTVMRTHRNATPDPVNTNTTTCCASTVNAGHTAQAEGTVIMSEEISANPTVYCPG